MRYVKTLSVVILLLFAGRALAEPTSHSLVKFGDEEVELRFSNIHGGERQLELWDATRQATKPAEQERLLRVRWEDFGEVGSLQSLAGYHLDRGDYLSGYAHLYAVDKFLKWYEATVTAPGYQGSYMPPGPLTKQVFVDAESDLKLVGEQLTASQRAHGVKLAAKLIRDNPNCCQYP